MDLLMKKIVSALSLILFMGMLTSGCQKDTLCQGEITVVRKDNGNPVANADVWSHYISTSGASSSRSDHQFTDASGHVHVNLNLPAILTITATRPTTFPAPPNIAPMDKADSTTLRFEAGKTNSCTIAL
ncbi:MAG TPA: hypothetical protein VNZ86_07680 [Bacteroidia bacterium]|jgi:hypothetical protein|nr:hypothetical protein [Bacteroidia bacterium]